ncbi:MAG: superoxide dismutase family protein [candidate division Zixibacteria bacterium]|nr:superoxide dismutase family protein [candidate division Zixibacteria bacterium]
MNKLQNYLVIIVIVVISVATSNLFGQQADENHLDNNISSGITNAIAVLYATKDNNVSGTITFTKVKGGIKVVATVTGLTEGKHGFHIHQFGDCSGADGKTAGGHFNPGEMDHGAPTDSIRHIGDIGNIVADADGNATLEWIDSHMTFEGASSIIGRGVIIHAGEDDLTSQPTGAAGARVACGVIGIAKAE